MAVWRNLVQTDHITSEEKPMFGGVKKQQLAGQRTKPLPGRPQKMPVRGKAFP